MYVLIVLFNFLTSNMENYLQLTYFRKYTEEDAWELMIIV